MSGKPWFRLYTSILMDPKFIALEMADRGWWLCLLTVAAFTDKAGALRPLSDLGAMLQRPPSDVRAAIERLVSVGLIDRRAGGARDDGNVTFHIHDWDEWQYDSDSSTNRVRKYRAAQRNVSGNDDETPQSRAEQSRAESTPLVPTGDDAIEVQWDRFRRAYPKRDGDQGWKVAKDKFARAVKNGTDAEVLILAAGRYREAMQRAGNTGDRAKFVKQASSWMNQQTWREYIPQPEAAPAKPVEAPAVVPVTEARLPPGVTWQAAMITFRKAFGTGAWPRDKLGPAPGEPGCLVPAELLTAEDCARVWPEHSVAKAQFAARKAELGEGAVH